MSEHSAKIKEQLAEKRRQDLSSALIRSAALGIALKGNTTPWLQGRLTDEQLEQAQSIAEEHRLHLEALRHENVEKYGVVPENVDYENDVDAESAA